MKRCGLALLLAALCGASGFTAARTAHGIRAVLQPQRSLVAALAPVAEPATAAPATAAPQRQAVERLPMRSEAAPSASSLLGKFVDLFTGHFDNIAQVTRERAAGLTPREGGGHEQIHCWLQPLPLTAPLSSTPSTVSTPNPRQFVLATYYFDGQPERTFRVRLYALSHAPEDAPAGTSVQMSIYRMREGLEDELKQRAGDAATVDWSHADLDPALRIPDCDIFWRWNPDGGAEGGAEGGGCSAGVALTQDKRVRTQIASTPME